MTPVSFEVFPSEGSRRFFNPDSVRPSNDSSFSSVKVLVQIGEHDTGKTTAANGLVSKRCGAAVTPFTPRSRTSNDGTRGAWAVKLVKDGVLYVIIDCEGLGNTEDAATAMVQATCASLAGLTVNFLAGNVATNPAIRHLGHVCALLRAFEAPASGPLTIIYRGVLPDDLDMVGEDGFLGRWNLALSNAANSGCRLEVDTIRESFASTSVLYTPAADQADLNALRGLGSTSSEFFAAFNANIDTLLASVPAMTPAEYEDKVRAAGRLFAEMSSTPGDLTARALDSECDRRLRPVLDRARASLSAATTPRTVVAFDADLIRIKATARAEATGVLTGLMASLDGPLARLDAAIDHHAGPLRTEAAANEARVRQAEAEAAQAEQDRLAAEAQAAKDEQDRLAAELAEKEAAKLRIINQTQVLQSTPPPRQELSVEQKIVREVVRPVQQVAKFFRRF